MNSLLSQKFKCPAGFHESTFFPDQGFIDDIDENHELILIKTPWNFDVNKLNGQEICLDGRQEIESSDDKKIIIDVSSSSKHTDNICSLKKTVSGDGALPVPIRFKKQMDVFESYNFPTAVIPRSKEKHIPSPLGLKERHTPYGSGDPVVFYKRKKKAKKRKEEILLHDARTQVSANGTLVSPAGTTDKTSKYSNKDVPVVSMKKKRKHKDETGHGTGSDLSQSLEDEQNSSPVNKKTKLSFNMSGVPPFSTEKRKKKKKKSDVKLEGDGCDQEHDITSSGTQDEGVSERRKGKASKLCNFEDGVVNQAQLQKDFKKGNSQHSSDGQDNRHKKKRRKSESFSAESKQSNFSEEGDKDWRQKLIKDCLAMRGASKYIKNEPESCESEEY